MGESRNHLKTQVEEEQLERKRNTRPQEHREARQLPESVALMTCPLVKARIKLLFGLESVPTCRKVRDATTVLYKNNSACLSRDSSNSKAGNSCSVTEEAVD